MLLNHTAAGGPARFKNGGNEVEGMQPLKTITSLMKDEPLNAEERLERLELNTNRKLEQFEEALGVFKDLVVKLHDEKEALKTENDSLKKSFDQKVSNVKNAIVKPLTDAGEGFVELLLQNEPIEKTAAAEQKVIGNANHVGFNPNSDEMDRTIAWMREKFGLPKAATEKQTKQSKKPKKKRK